MQVLWFSHPSFEQHQTPSSHPERPQRLAAVEAGGVLSGLPRTLLNPPPIAAATLERIHPRRYWEAIEKFCQQGGGQLDPDTWVGPESWEAALRSTGAGLEAIRLLSDSPTETTAFLAVRPPGHHALPTVGMGFCVFNNIAVAAAELYHGQNQRVVILDWDVHHGNGTEAVIDRLGTTLYVSLHQSPFYPHTSSAQEYYQTSRLGRVLNIPLPANTGGDLYRLAFDRLVIPAISDFAPDWILVSAGYDAFNDDPLAQLRLVPADYQYMSSRLRGLLEPNRIVFFLEGGYNLEGLTQGVSATLVGLSGLSTDASPLVSPQQPRFEQLSQHLESGLPPLAVRS